jgi:hypothetical protein
MITAVSLDHGGGGAGVGIFFAVLLNQRVASL